MRDMKELFDSPELSEAGKEFRIITPEGCKNILRRVDAKLLRADIYHLYFAERMTQRDVAKTLGVTRGKVQRIFNESGWVGRHVERAIDSAEVRRLYDKDTLTQEQIARKLGVSRTYIWKTLQETKSGESSRHRKLDIDLKKAHFLYCEKGLSQADVAKELGIAQTTFGRRVREFGWKRKKPERKPIDVKMLHHLYYEQSLSQRDVAKQLGIPIKDVKKKFKELGWRAGPRGVVFDVEEVQRLQTREGMSRNDIAIVLGVSQARLDIMFADFKKGKIIESMDGTKKIGSNSQRLEAKRLREHIFGRVCTICGVDKDQRMLAVHRKDGTPHKTELVWNTEKLKALDPNEWTLLCPHCHRSVHWSMSHLTIEWNVISELLSNKSRKPLKRHMPIQLPRESIRELRFALFGHECEVCGRHKEKHKLVLHRKDGEYHQRGSTWTIEFLRTAQIEEWVILCDRCHIGIHWFMDQFGLRWNKIKSYFNPNGR